MISVPFQFNANPRFGPRDGNQYTLLIQPVIPFELNDDWNLIARTTIPVFSNPSLRPGSDRSTGLGNTQLQLFFSPKEPTESGLIWGAGPIISTPTNTGEDRGPDRWGLGPTAVVLKVAPPWVYGAVGQHVWSVSGGKDAHINSSLVEPFVNYNLGDGTYLTSSPIITADWKAKGSDTWLVPVGGGVGQIFHIGQQACDAQIQTFYNVHRPEDANRWNIRCTFKLLYPKKKKKKAPPNDQLAYNSGNW
jgi:hypothetical protein